MCDLWRHTTDGATPPGALPAQIRLALAKELPCPELPCPKLPGVASDQTNPRWVKLYNSSNFFDPRCVPREDWDAIAELVSPFGRVIVENHPRMVGDDVGRFATRIAGRLEVAMGLETVYEPSIRLLNKQMSLEDFERAAARLKSFGVDLRVFILVQPAGMASGQGVGWAIESVRFARRCGARHASLIATRGGNGMMESFSARGLFTPPRADCLEDALAESMRVGESMRDPMVDPMVVTADLWDFQRLAGLCDRCVEPRRRRLFEMNLSQRILPPWESDCACRDESP
jgi:radical SAM enzyme (TIGR01210 family)